MRRAALGRRDLVAPYTLTFMARIAISACATAMRIPGAVITGVMAVHAVVARARVAMLMIAVRMRIFMEMRTLLRGLGYRLRVRRPSVGVRAKTDFATGKDPQQNRYAEEPPEGLSLSLGCSYACPVHGAWRSIEECVQDRLRNAPTRWSTNMGAFGAEIVPTK